MTSTRQIKIGDVLYDEKRFGLIIKIVPATLFLQDLYYIQWNDGRIAQEQIRFVRCARNQASALRKRLKRKNE